MTFYTCSCLFEAFEFFVLFYSVVSVVIGGQTWMTRRVGRKGDYYNVGKIGSIFIYIS